MKATKRLMALFLALVMTMAMAFPAFADDTTYTITINGSSAGHTYEAYQIFDGDLSGETLSNITWGTGVNGDALLTALKGDDTIGEDFAEAASAADVAKVLTGSEYGDNSENLDAFAAVVGKNLAGSATGTSNGATKNEDKYQYTITGLDAGYYFVKDADDSVAESDAYTKFMLELVADTEITPKSDVPSVDKKVLEDDKYNQDGGYGQGFNDVADYDIGEEITFKLIGKVPEMDGYDTYEYIFHDTMAEVLELTNENLEDNFTVYIADSQEADEGTRLTAGSDYTVAEGEDCTFEIRFEDLKSVVGEKENANYIIVTYTARLNSSAEPGLDGYINEVELEFSNNPNLEGEGETGRTPEDKVIVFTY